MKNGPYELVKAPDTYPGKKYRGRYIYKHHLIWWKNTGEIVPDGSVIHHKNGNKRDNRFINLKLETRGDHTKTHHEIDSIEVKCGWCSSNFTLKPHVFRFRQKHSRSGRLFCSKSHQVRFQQSQRRHCR